MVQFDYDGVMKRYNVKVPFTLAGESDRITVASISEDVEPKITLHRELSIRLLRQIIIHWDEYEHQRSRELNELLEDEPKNDKLTYLKERLQVSSWKDISVDELEWYSRTWYVMDAAGIRTIGQLVENGAKDLFKLKNCGRKTVTDIKMVLNELGLALKQ
tara:strand:+ start:88 stop:567 length:480 start_codon:yes stop_codon:yes gene_type:complete